MIHRLFGLWRKLIIGRAITKGALKVVYRLKTGDDAITLSN